MVGIVVDSPSVNKCAFKTVRAEKPKLSVLLCVCHIVSLFFKDFFRIPQVAEVWSVVNDTSNKFRAVKWLREALMRVQREDEGLKAMKKPNGKPLFNPTLGYIKYGRTRMASKKIQTTRAGTVNFGAKIVVNSTEYAAKYEKKKVSCPVFRNLLEPFRNLFETF